MIPQIKEVNFGPNTANDYATLHQATVNLATMGDRTITTQVRIDGDVVPDFTGWELEFRGERFILPTREPQARKDNTTKNSLIDLTFYSWPVYELKRYFFVEMASINSGTAIADKYDATLALNLENFVDAFNLVLDYYFDGKIQISLFGQGQHIYPTEPVVFEINYTKLWDVLTKIYEMYNVRWWFDYDSASGIYLIKVGYTADSIDDHDFSYGYKGGLLSFERTVQDDDLVNILLGRGGEKNLPYRYFKRTDPGNPGWIADPDAIPELANIYFDRLRDVNFRWYVRGWMTNPNRDRSWEQAGYVYPTYSTADIPSYPTDSGLHDQLLYAFNRGKTDEKFNPVEFVSDTLACDASGVETASGSIAAHGEVWGALDDNDDIFPTIQGVTVSPYGRIDESVAISQIVTDDISAYASAAAVETTIKDMRIDPPAGSTDLTYTLYSDWFTIPAGETGNVTYRPLSNDRVNPNFVYYDTTRSTLVAEPATGADQPGTPSYDETTGLYAVSGLPAGTYRLKLNLVLRIDRPATSINGTFGIENIVLTTSAVNTNAWKPTFDIWVKNLWQTTQGANESNKDYAERVWGPILGDRLGNEAKIVFSTGAMSISQDYEFVIADYPVPDRTKTLNGVPSEWKITVYKSDAEYQATGLYIPNASSAQPVAGDKFFFIGIDMPFQYVEWAEERLNKYKRDNLDGMSEISPTWTLKLDKVRINSLEDEDYGQRLADRLDAGVMIRTTDPRFTPGEVLSLYIQSITWTWNEPTKGNPYIVPDVEVVLADKISVVEGPISRLENDVDIISQNYVQSGDVESVVRRVAGALFLKKTGESDSSSSPTTFSSKVTSRGFRKGGIGGAGWGLYEDNSRRFSQSAATRADVTDEEETIEPRSVLEVDRLIVREEMEVNNLVINQISARGGKEIISAARIEVTLVRETNAAYVCYFDQKQSSVANLFQVNDIAYGQVWSADNTELRFYKMRVSAVDVNSITLAKSGRYGSGAPQEGDIIVQYGNTTNTARQYVIVRDVVGGGHDRMLSGLNSVSATGTEYYFAGVETGETPRWFVGDRNAEYAEYKNGQLNIKGRLSVLKSDGTYQSMSEYINQITINEQNLQAQIDGQIQSWSGNVSPLPVEVEGSVDPSTANYPANQWTTDTERLKHMGDIYVNNTSGQGYRYTRQANNGNFYWMRISDEEVALALQRANQALAGVAGMQYLTAALNGSTIVQGGLVLTSLIQLGQTEEGVFNVYSGINGTMDANAYGNGIAAWYGGPMTDHEADPTALTYANSLFRFDGSGYLAGGLLNWGLDNGQAYLNLNGEAVIAGTGGVSLGDIANLMFEIVQYDTGHYAAKLKNTAYYNGSQVTLDGLFSDGWLSGGGLSSSGPGGGLALGDLTDVDLQTVSPTDGQALVYSDAANGGLGGWIPGSVSGTGNYLPLSGGIMTGIIRLNTTSTTRQGAFLRFRHLDENDAEKIDAEIGANTSSSGLLGLYSRGSIVLRPGNGTDILTSYGLMVSTSDITFNGQSIRPKFFYGTCTTASGTLSKVVSCPGFTSSNLVAGTVIVIEMKYSSDTQSNVTLNVNNTGAHYIYTPTAGAYKSWRAEENILCVYTTSGDWMLLPSYGYLYWHINGGSAGSSDTWGDDEENNVVSLTIDGTTKRVCLEGYGGGGAGTSYSAGTGLELSGTTFSLKTATTNGYGGVKIAAAKRSNNPTLVTGLTTGTYYGVEMRQDGRLFVAIDDQGGGSVVEVNPIVTSGTQIATITVGGVAYNLFAPTSEGSSIDLSNYVTLNGSQSITGAKTFLATNTTTKNILPSSNKEFNLGSTARFWNSVYADRIYIGNTDAYLEYDSAAQCVRIHNAGIAVDSFVSAGGLSTTS